MPTHISVPTRLRLGAFAGGAALALGVLTAAPVYAHDSLIASTPEADEVLTESPEEVVLEFSGSGLTTGEGITNEIVVLDADEQDWTSEDPAEVDGSTLSTDIPEPLPNGEYEVHYRVVYSDGHDEERSFGFEVDAPVTDEEDDDAQPIETEEADETSEPTDSSAGEETEAEETPGAEDEDAETEASEPEDGAEEDDQESDQGGALGWVVIAAAVLVLAGVVGYLLRRRRTDSTQS